MTALKPYPAYRKTDLPWLGQIPAHWEVKPLKYSVFLNPEVLSETTDPDYVIQYLDIGNVDEIEGVGAIQEFRFENAPSRARRRVRAGDTIISTVRTYLKAIAYFENPPENQIVSTGFAVLRPKSNIYPQFLSWLIQSKPFIEKVVVHSVGIGYPAINASDLVSFKVWLPPLLEQQTIAAYLDRQTAKVDALIAKKERLLELLAEKRSALIDHSVTKGLNPKVKMKDSGLQWLGKIPEHWDVIRSKRLFGLRNVKASDTDKQLTVSQEFGVITQEDYMAKGSRVVQVIKGADILKHVEPNDFIISMRSFQGGIEWSKIGGSTSSAYVVLTPNEQVHCPFFAYFLKSSQYIQALQSTSNLVRDGQALRYTNFCLVDLPVVPLEEQKAIAEYLDKEIARIDTLVEKIYQAIERLREYRAALISSVVTGKVEVKG